ncbi:MAG: hypothetical protein NTX49_08510 [Chlamydiae bacterium]|nr:hypothetical protein [Chlamydiota bacterium]
MEERIINELKKSKLTRYWPLLCLILIAALAASAISSTMRPLNVKWMHSFMGVFLCQFAMLKLFNPRGFADGFQKYDIIASKSRLYAYIYPLIELALGLGYLRHTSPNMLYIVTIVVLGTGAVGVIQALLKGLDVRCACMGTTLDVPLSTVTLTEDIGMVIMAALLLFKI